MLRTSLICFLLVPILVLIAGSAAFANTFVFPHLLETSGSIINTQNVFDTTIYVSYIGDVTGTGCLTPDDRVVVSLYLFKPDGTPLRSSTNADVCSPCVFPMGGGGLGSYEAIVIGDLINAAGGFATPVVEAFAVLDVPANGDRMTFTPLTVYANQGPTDLQISDGEVIPVGVPVADPACGRLFVVPRLIVTGVDVLLPQSWNTVIDLAYTGGLLVADTDSVQIDIYLFDETTGDPLQGGTGPVCSPCTLTMGPADHQVQFSVGEAIAMAAGSFPALGYMVAHVTGDAGNVGIKATTVNAQTNVGDLVFFETPVREIPLDGVSPVPGSAAFQHLINNLGNHPNPFNPRTTIDYHLAEAGEVKVRILDARGHLVRILVDGFQVVGRHELPWDGRDDQGRAQASGVYFGRVESGGTTQVVKLALVK